MDILTRLRLAAVAAFVWAKHWWQFASIRLAVFAGFISGLQAEFPDQYAQVIKALPDSVRPLIGLLVAVAAIYSRTKSQPGIVRRGDGQ
ncbi:MAG: hypothetical protein K2Q27_16125 [Novosphingobium sp.]|jgi:hypothetical protein|uniref:DUF7940 domain-containing protein n=1 Tax=Novosphingobium sp. NDB2Meth1 TaxID=1892847 RepID=UPI00093197A1|nr:hypothetical protein [Novosphingobium sp. NDB2Meth1]MBY0394779.1 hypothetical protein [Novosphingobium sp.]